MSVLIFFLNLDKMIWKRHRVSNKKKEYSKAPDLSTAWANRVKLTLSYILSDPQRRNSVIWSLPLEILKIPDVFSRLIRKRPSERRTPRVWSFWTWCVQIIIVLDNGFEKSKFSWDEKWENTPRGGIGPLKENVYAICRICTCL